MSSAKEQQFNALAAQLQHATSEDYFYLLDDIIRLEYPPAIDVIIAALNYEYRDVKWRAAEALGYEWFKGDKAIQALLPMLGDENRLVREVAALALFKNIGRDAVPHLLAADCYAPLEALGTEAIPYLIDGMRKLFDYHSAVALKQLKWQPQTTDEKIIYAISIYDWQTVIEIGRASIPYLKRCLIDDYDTFNVPILETLARLGEDTLPDLIAMMESDYPYKRPAIDALVRLGKTLPNLAHMLLQGDFHIGSIASKLGYKSRITKVLTRLHQKSTNPDERLVIIDALAALKGG
jgi:HEAT repeat protein